MQKLHGLGLVVILVGSLIANFSGAGVAHAQEADCVRGTFKDYHNEGQSGVIPAGYNGPVFKLRQDYPQTLPPQEDYPWATMEFKNGGPVDPQAYLEALKNYSFEGNWEVEWQVEKNTTRNWYHVPWLDYTANGREFTHGLTHELDMPAGALGALNTSWTSNWAVAVFNDRASWAFGQMWCDPNAPKPDMLNPNNLEPNWFPEGAVIAKLLFNDISDTEAPYMKDALTWQVDRYVEPIPSKRTPADDPTRALQPVRLIQVDLSVRDTRSPTGWLMGSYTYDGRKPGGDPVSKLAAIGIQWGNDPGVTPEMVAQGVKLKETWVNDAIRDLPSNHLGWAGRIAGPADAPSASCMSCHMTAGYPQPPILSLAYPIPKAPNPTPWPNQHQLAWFTNVPAGNAWSYDTEVSLDYSLQLPMSYQNFITAKKDVAEMEQEKFSPRGEQRVAPADLVPVPADNTPFQMVALVIGGVIVGIGVTLLLPFRRRKK